MEGSSIGISQENIVTSVDSMLTLAGKILEQFQQPVLIEEFVAGREVSYSRIQNAGDDAWALSEIVMEGDPGFFEHRLFDAHEKLLPRPDRYGQKHRQ